MKAPESAAWLGRRYLASMPREDDVRSLVTAMAGNRAEELSRLDLRSLRDLLAKLQQHDLACGDVIQLNDRRLSRTEARLYALAALV